MAFPRLELTIRSRVILLFTLLIGLSVASSALVYQRIAGIGDSVDQQARGIAGQMVAIDEQSELIDQQRALGKLSERVTVAQQHMGAMQYWYFHAALNADMESLDKAQAASEQLVDELAAMVAADSRLQAEIAEMTETVEQYRTLGEKMFEFFEKSMMLMGRSMAEAAREQAVSLTASLNDIRSGYQQREAVLTGGVLEAGETVRRASDQVAISGGAIRHEIDRAGSVSLIMAGALVISALLLGTLFLRSLLRPVRRLGQRIGEIQADNDLRGSLEYRKNDELSVITRAFDQMLARFGGLIGHVAASTRARLETRVEAVAETIAGLASQSQSIGQVVDVIRGISEKTNLLALNAAIEAVEAGREESRTTVQRIRQCSESLGLIDEKAGEMRLLNQQVAQAAAEQSEAVSKIDENLINLKRQIEDISDNARDTGSMTDSLASLSEVLRGNISQFRY